MFSNALQLFSFDFYEYRIILKYMVVFKMIVVGTLRFHETYYAHISAYRPIL